jgi:hypothetical protein
MGLIVGIIKFISSVIAVFSTGLFTLSCISSIINPQLVVEGDIVKEKNQNSRLIFLLITAIAWGIVIAL